MLKILSLLLVLSTATVEAHALSSIEGAEALNYLSDIREHLVSGGYSYNLLGRAHRDSMNGRFSDGILFCPGNGKIDFIRRKDGDHAAVFHSPNGRVMEPVTEEAWRLKLANAISDDNPKPTVFFDEHKNILGIVFSGKDARIRAQLTEQGLLRVEISIPGARDKGRSRRRGPF